MEQEDNGDWCTWNNPQMICKGTKRLKNLKTRGDHPDYSIITIRQSTEKSLGELK